MVRSPRHLRSAAIAALLIAIVSQACTLRDDATPGEMRRPFVIGPRTPTTTIPPTIGASTTVPPTIGASTTAPPPTTTTTAPTTTTTTLPPLEPPTFESLEGIDTILDFARRYTAQGLTQWQRSLPEAEDIRITSTADGTEQPALYLAPRGDRPRPLLVVLHSWSTGYTQHAGIPFALWAQENGWGMIAPNFRGPNRTFEAVGSELSVQDVIDAIDHAIAQGGVDTDRVYTVGFSGGGMMSLLLAGRHPDRVDGVAAWTPVGDLIGFYEYSRARGSSYAWQVQAGCGGDPRVEGPARDQCIQRSPSSYLDQARVNGVPVFIGQGIWDRLVPPSQAAETYNQLAEAEHRFTDAELADISRRRIPEHLNGAITTEIWFEPGDPTPLFGVRSGNVWFVLFRGAHDMVYGPALHWFASDPG